MSLLHPHSKRFIYPTASLEEQRLRRILIGAILEFGEPHDFESGAMTRPLTQDKNGGYMPTPQPNNPQKALEYYMLQEEGDGYAIFGAVYFLIAGVLLHRKLSTMPSTNAIQA